MINPAQFQRVLGQASDEQLMTMLRRPDKIPSQFIVAEINRRQAMRQASKAQQAGLAQQMAQQPPSQMQQMPRQEPRMEPRGMREGGMVANAQQLSEISNQLSNLVDGGGPSGGISNLLSGNGSGPNYALAQPAYQRVPFAAQLFGGFGPRPNDFGSRPSLLRGMNKGGIPLPMPPMRKPSVGQRNRNPMNLRPISGEPFFGTVGVSPQNYTIFDSDLAGLRAGFVNMDTQKKKGVDTIRGYIGAYAPVGENAPLSVSNYMKFVADSVGVGVDDKIDLSDADTQLKIADAQIKFENNADDDYYKSISPLLEQAQVLSDDKTNNPFMPVRRQVSTAPPAANNAQSVFTNRILGLQNKAQQSQQPAPTDTARPAIFDTIDSLAARGDLDARRSLEAMVTDPDFGNPTIKNYARTKLGELMSGKAANELSRSVASSDDAGILSKFATNIGGIRGRLAKQRADEAAAAASQSQLDAMPNFDGPPRLGDQTSNYARNILGIQAARAEDVANAEILEAARNTSLAADDAARMGLNAPSIGTQRRDARRGEQTQRTDLLDRIQEIAKGLLPVPDGSSPKKRRGNVVTNLGVPEEAPETEPRVGAQASAATTAPLQPLEADDAARQEGITAISNQPTANTGGLKPVIDNGVQSFLNLLQPGPTIAKAELSNAVGGEVAGAAQNLATNAQNNTLGGLAMDGAFDITTLQGDIKQLSKANQDLVKDYNKGAAELLKKRTELMEQLDGQRRTPQNMMFKALIDFGLELAASPEVNFLRAVAQAGKKGIATFDTLTKQDQQKLFQKYKMAYDIAAAEFDHNIKGRKLAVDAGMQAVSLANTLSQISYRSQMAKASLIKANKPTANTSGAANARALFNAYIKVLDDPLAAIDSGQIPEGYIIRNKDNDAIGVDRNRFITDAAARFGIALEDLVTELPPLPKSN